MTDIRNGLSSEEAKKLKEDGLDNIPVGNQSKTIGQIVAGNVLTYFNFVFAVFAGLLIFVGSYNNMTFLPIIILNTIIGIVQEIRAKITLDRLTVVNAPKTKVIRDSYILRSLLRVMCAYLKQVTSLVQMPFWQKAV